MAQNLDVAVVVKALLLFVGGNNLVLVHRLVERCATSLGSRVVPLGRVYPLSDAGREATGVALVGSKPICSASLDTLSTMAGVRPNSSIVR